LIELSADVLGIDRVQLDELRTKRLLNRDDLRREWSGAPRAGIDVAEQVRRRLQLLRDLDGHVRAIGLELGLGGDPPPQTPP